MILQHCPPNPTLEYANSIVPPNGDKEIISKGGGSTLDVGKWVAFKYKLKHTAIPTTAGTGSEVTKYIVLTVNKKKKTFSDSRYIPDSYILDPKNVVTLPELHTISSGLDAMSQALESFWSLKATDESKAYSTAAFTLILENLPLCVKYPKNERYRMNMLIGANLSGRAINITRTNVCHAFSYPLTEWYKIPHGIACSLTLCHFTKLALGLDLKEWMSQFNLPKYEINWKMVRKAVRHNPKLKDFPIKLNAKNLLSSDL